jgi:hypothetical protein
MTRDQFRDMTRQFLLGESMYDDWHGGTYGSARTPSYLKIIDTWEKMGGSSGKPVFSYDLARELDVDDPSEIDYTGTGLTMRGGLVVKKGM